MRNPKKICMIIDSWDPILGGAQVHIKELSKRLIDQYDCEIHLVTRDISGGKKKNPKREELMDGKFIVHRLGFPTSFGNIAARAWWCFRTGIYLRNLQLKEHFDLIHAHAFLSSYPARMARFLTGLPVVYTVHGTSLFHKRTGFRAWLERDLLTRYKYDREISVAENFLQLNNVNKQIAVIPNGINLETIDKVPAPEREDEKFKVLYVGRFDRIKGVDVLIQGIAELAAEGFKKELEVRLVGYAYEIEKLKKLVKKLKLTRVVKFVGKKEGEELMAEYKSADVFVLPSYSEGQSITLVEACACGLPILATDVGDNGKLVKEDVNGYLIQAGNSHSISEYLKRFASHPHLRNMGDASRAILEEADLTWESATEKTYKVYKGVLRDLKGVSFPAKAKDALRDPRMPHRIIGQVGKRVRLLKIADRRMKMPDSIPVSVTVDFERDHGSKDTHSTLEPSIETGKKFIGNFREFAEQQEFKSTLFVQGNVIPELAEEFRGMEEAGHEIGLHGMHHGLWGDAKWFLDDRPLTKAERMKFMADALRNFEEAGLRRPVSFRAPNLVANDTTYEILAQNDFKYDSSYPTFWGGKPLPYEINGIKGAPISFDPVPHFNRVAGILPVTKYYMMTTYHFLRLSDEEIERIFKTIFWMQKKAKVKPHIVLLMHSWEFQSSDTYKYCSGDNYGKFAKRFYALAEKFPMKFMTFEKLMAEVSA